MDISKLRLSAADVNREISRRLEALGRIVYDSQKSGYDPTEMVKESISCIDELYEQLDVISSELDAARNKVTCPQCGSVNPQESFYCSRCGAKLVKDEPADEVPAEPEKAAPTEEVPPVPEETPAEEEPKDE